MDNGKKEFLKTPKKIDENLDFFTCGPEFSIFKKNSEN